MFLWKMVFLVIIFFTCFSSSLFMSCLMFVVSSMVISISFLSMNFSWLMYSMIILYLGGMMVLFMYMCSISSIAKIESSSMIMFLAPISGLIIIYYFLPMNFMIMGFTSLEFIYSSYLMSSQLVLLFLAYYLIMGLLVSIFFIEKLYGPLKSMYVK